MSQGIVLYGPPAAGKDTVTRALAALDPRYGPFARLKIGSGNTSNYRMGTREDLDALDASGDVIYRNERYGNTYVIDRPGIVDAMRDGRVPVVHLGQVVGVQALLRGCAADWCAVLLWCPRAVTQQRSAERGDTDTGARIAAWHATRADLDQHPAAIWNLSLRTDEMGPADAARRIDTAVRGGTG